MFVWGCWLYLALLVRKTLEGRLLYQTICKVHFENSLFEGWSLYRGHPGPFFRRAWEECLLYQTVCRKTNHLSKFACGWRMCIAPGPSFCQTNLRRAFVVPDQIVCKNLIIFQNVFVLEGCSPHRAHPGPFVRRAWEESLLYQTVCKKTQFLE